MKATLLVKDKVLVIARIAFLLQIILPRAKGSGSEKCKKTKKTRAHGLLPNSEWMPVGRFL